MTGGGGGKAEFTAEVVRVLRSLEPGDVVSYGEVAEEAGFPGAARAVGRVLKEVDGVPWWRVVTAAGRLVPGHELRQRELLGREGVEVIGNRVTRVSR